MSRPGGIRHRGHDARGQARAERDYKAHNDVQACTVCGRLFTRYAKDSLQHRLRRETKGAAATGKREVGWPNSTTTGSV
jgi:hypothetical protein